MSADVIVIGAGLAGLAIANRCAERGLRVTVLEQGAGEQYPCNSRMSSGFLHVARQDINAGSSVLRQAIDDATRGAADPTLAAILADDAPQALRWLRAAGVRVMRGGWRPAHRVAFAPPVPHRAGANGIGRGPDHMLRRLVIRLTAHGGLLLRGFRAIELLMDEQRFCAGVGVERGTQKLRFDAPAVVIADGGFQSDHELLRRYVTKVPDRLLQRNAGTGNGDGVRMAALAGALLAGMESFYGHVHCRDAMSNAKLWPNPTVDLPLTAGIAVNGRGERFADEGLGGIYMANAIARLDDPFEAVAIFDSPIWENSGRNALVPANPHLASAGGTLHKSQTIEGLAVAIGLSPEALAVTVGRYNRALANDARAHARSAALKPADCAAAHQDPPFYAIPLCAGITYTMGGIAIDGQCRVLRFDGSGIIEGLYAVGSASAGLEGGPVAGYAGGLAKALVFGLRAGDSIADRMAHPFALQARG